MTTLKVHKVHPQVTLPKFQTQESACFDLSFQPYGKDHITGYTAVNGTFTRFLNPQTGKVTVAPSERAMIPTGLIFDIPKGYSIRIHPRSGISYKKGIVLSNCEGVVDSDYVEEIYILVHNTSERNFDIQVGDRIAQAEMVKCEEYTIEETKERPTQKTDRAGGMGSTGINSVEETVPEPTEETAKRGRGRPKKVTA